MYEVGAGSAINAGAGGVSGGGAALSATDYANIGAGAGSILGPVLTGFQEHGWAQAANQHAMAFARWMDNTKYQRAVRDLKRSGLNPALAYTSGVSTVGSPAMQIGRAREPDFGAALGAAKQFAVQRENVRILKAEADRAEELAKQSRVDTSVKSLTARDLVVQAQQETKRSLFGIRSEQQRGSALEMEAQERYFRTMLSREERNVVEQDVVLRRLNIEQLIVELEVMRANAAAAKQQAEFDASPEGQLLYKARRYLEVGKPVGDALMRGSGGALRRGIR